ncbi:MAG: NADH-quinone oxidoreductase subunit H [Oligoflexia bacterium]|nr:NADH-quinone oxidoreductase subunit H [Oligoflexia bacterium]
MNHINHMNKTLPFIQLLIPLLLAPLLYGIINRTKAIFAGRVGSPLLQTYYDLYKLLHKNFIYSDSSTWIIRAGTLVILAATIINLLLLPLANVQSAISFSGDILLFVYMFSLVRFMMILSGMDVGSSFEAMGSAREGYFAMLAEPAILLALITLSTCGDLQLNSSLSVNTLLSVLTLNQYFTLNPTLLILVPAFFLILLLETSRIPFDDPNTHLELTMIHEVIILDHAGLDLAFITYATSLKLWIFSSIIAHLLIPIDIVGNTLINILIHILAIFIICIIIGIVESTCARLRLIRVQNLILGALVLTFISFITSWI